MDKMDQTTERLSSEFAAMKQRIQDLEQHVEEQGIVIDELRRTVDRKDQRVRELECQVQDIRMEQNRPYLIFEGEGVPSPPSQRPWTEDIRGTVVDMVGKYLPDVWVEKKTLNTAIVRLGGEKLCVNSCGMVEEVPGTRYMKSESLWGGMRQVSAEKSHRVSL